MVETLLIERIKEIKTKIIPRFEGFEHSARAKMAMHLLALNETMLEILRNRHLNRYR